MASGLLIALAGLLAFFVVSLRVPVEARDLGYYLNGLIVIGVLAYGTRSRG